MSDSMNNKELVAVGHQFAKAMSSETPILDIAKIVSRLAERLDCTTAALRETQKQRDASVQAERTWETVMMQACGEDGPKSGADKFAELQAKFAAMAAELQAVKNYRPQPGGAIMMKALDAFEAQDDYPEGGMMDAFEILCCKGVETPATDAFLAELRSSGLDEMAVAYRKFASEEGCSCNMQSSYNLTAERAESYAAYVRRQGVVQ